MGDNLKKWIKLDRNQHPLRMWHPEKSLNVPPNGAFHATMLWGGDHSAENCYLDPPSHWDKHRQVVESWEMVHISDTDITDGKMVFEFPLLQRLYEQMCFDINRNTDCISKTEDCFIQQA